MMASGKAHDISCCVMSVPAALGGAYAADLLHVEGAGIWLLSVTAAAGAISGLWLTPDLDLVNRDIKGCRALSLGWYWRLYGRLPHHSRWSHWPILSTIGRLLYAFPVPLLIWHFAGLGLLWWVSGLAIADFTHWVLDGCPVRPGNDANAYLLPKFY